MMPQILDYEMIHLINFIVKLNKQKMLFKLLWRFASINLTKLDSDNIYFKIMSPHIQQVYLFIKASQGHSAHYVKGQWYL